ncbi:MAG: IS4 family transposase [Bacteroidaceae bacterium]|nr:IS4 family transposase [Bacteroidaceae bacterium]
MNKDKYVFAQLVEFLDCFKFRRIVAKYQGDRYIKSFSCWNQLLVMMFGQLSNREGLRDLIVALEAHWRKLYHLGMGKSVTRSNLAKANEQRDYRIFEDFAYHLVAEARSKSTEKIFGFDGHVYAFDSTTIDLCLEVFEWAKFRKHKGGIKIHTLYDIEAQVPAFFHITTASTNDIKAMPEIPYEKGAYYIFDRGYNDFSNLFKIEQIEATFVVRAKKNLKFEQTSWKRRLPKNVLSDSTIEFTVYKSSKDYPIPLRRVVYYDEEQGRTFVFLTNNFVLPAPIIAELYRNRWSVELFFKWLKQHLKIKKFWGTSENAVRIQIYCAIITYCLVVIVKHDMKLERSVYEILQIVGISLTDKTNLRDLFDKSNINNVNERFGSSEPSLFNF